MVLQKEKDAEGVTEEKKDSENGTPAALTKTDEEKDRSREEKSPEKKAEEEKLQEDAAASISTAAAAALAAAAVKAKVRESISRFFFKFGRVISPQVVTKILLLIPFHRIHILISQEVTGVAQNK